MSVKPLTTLLALLTLASLISSPSQAQGQSHTLPTRHLHEAVLNGRAKLVGHLPGSQTLRFDITLSLGRPDELQQFLRSVYDKSSPQFRQFVTPEQFTDRFGPTQSDSDRVLSFAQKHGFRLLGGSRHQMNLQFEGSVANIESAFHVLLNNYEHPVESRNFYSPDRELTTDESLAIWHVSGLDNFSIPHPAGLRSANKVDHPDSSITFDGYYLASTWRTAYYGGSLTGTGQTVGIIEFGPFNPKDVAYTFSSAGQSNSVPINAVPVDGAVALCTTSCDLTEDATSETEPILDIVQVASMAPGLSAINVYVDGNGSSTAMLSAVAIQSPLDNQISSSLAWGPADPAIDEPYFWRFAAQGQSYFNATGDHGNYADYAAVYTADSSPIYPADDSWVTAVGGTSLTPNPTTGAWQSETAWSVPSGCNLTSGISNCNAGGGGVSPDGIAIPWYQTYLAVIASKNSSATLRNVPDVSANAGQPTYICVNTANVPAGNCSGIGGTSAAAPLWAGYMALVNERAALNSEGSVGFINPYIYNLGANGGSSYTSAFHDIADGSSNGAGYTAVAGYDLVTGWGSPNGAGLLSALTDNLFHYIANPIGAIASGGVDPFVFVTGVDGNLWLNYGNGSARPWGTVGKPSSTSIAGAVGVIASNGVYPYAFVKGTDGNLWVNYDSGSAWAWFNLGKPSSTSIAGAVGVIASSGVYPYAFVTGTDGNLWVNYDSGSAWAWFNLGKPSGTSIAGAVGVIASNGVYPYTFVTGTDGNLWVNYDSGSAWAWFNLGKPSSTSIAGAVGVIASSGVYPYAFVTGTDGNLWVNYDSGSAWAWFNLGKPSSTSIAGAVGVIASNGVYPYIFVTGADGNLWLDYDTGSAWQWLNFGKPSGTNIAGAVGVIVSGGVYPYVFVTGTDGNLWLDYDTGSAWQWLNLEQP